MDRRATTPLRWPIVLLVLLAFAGPWHVAVRAAAPPSDDTSPVRIVLSGAAGVVSDQQPDKAAAWESTAAAAEVHDSPQGVTIELHQPGAMPGARPPVPVVSPEPTAAFEPPSYPRLKLSAPQPSSPVATGMADSSERPPTTPSQQPQPHASVPDPERAPPLPAGVSPREPTEPSVHPEPGRRPATAQPVVEQPGATQPDPEPVAEDPAEATPEGPQPLPDRSASLLMPPSVLTARSDQLERIAQQADRQTRRGFELAGRGAYFAARSQFIKALRLVAQGLDTEHQTDVHSRCLAAGLTAITESADFIPTGSRLEADLDVHAIVEGHRTPVLKDADLDGLTPMSALQCYFTFAQEQLAAAAGSEVAGSMALHAMGKLHAAMARLDAGSVVAAESKAVAFYQAALLTYPRNHMAANDLGVLLARCGHAQDAEAAFRFSLSVNQETTTWHNLAVVYQQLGNRTLANQAEQLSQNTLRAETARRRVLQDPSQQMVHWVNPDAFNQLGTADQAVGPPAVATAKPAKATPPSQAPEAEQNPLMGLVPWKILEKRR